MPIIALYPNSENKEYKITASSKPVQRQKCYYIQNGVSFFNYTTLHPPLKLQPQKNHQAILLNTKSEGNLS